MRENKLMFWLNYGLDNFGKRFWVTFGNSKEKNRPEGMLIVFYAHEFNLIPICPFPKQGQFPKGGTGRVRNNAYGLVMRLLASMEMEDQVPMAEKIVLENYRGEASREVGKLARKVRKAYGAKPEGINQQLDLQKINIIYWEDLYTNGKVRGEEFFKAMNDVAVHAYMSLSWRYFIGGRNFENTNLLPDYSICPIQLPELELETQKLVNPGPLILLMQEAGRFLERPDWERFSNLRHLIGEAKKKGSIHTDELEPALRLLINFLLRKLNSDSEDSLQQAKELFLNHLTNDLLLKDGKILPRDLKSIFSIFVRLGDVESVRKYYDQFHGMILNDPDGNARKYNLAVLLYAEGSFKEAASLFVEVMHAADDFYLKSDGKTYAIRCLIEFQVESQSGEVDFFPASLESVRVFFSRQKGPQLKRSLFYINLHKLLLRFVEAWGLTPEGRKNQWEELRKDTLKFQDAYLRNWLIEKIDICLNNGEKPAEH